MLWLLGFGLFVAVVAATWFMGLWSNLLNVVNFLLAAMLATSFYEPLADWIEARQPTFTYALDFLSLWGIFFVTFGGLRVATDLLSRNRLRFHIAVEMVGRSLLSLWLAVLFLSFTLFSLHMAPLPADAWGNGFQPTPGTRNLGLGFDRWWLALAQSRSRGALAESRNAAFLAPYDLPLRPEDERLGVRVFDPQADFIFRYRHRREVLGQQQTLRVHRAQ